MDSNLPYTDPSIPWVDDWPVGKKEKYPSEIYHSTMAVAYNPGDGRTERQVGKLMDEMYRLRESEP